MGEASAAVSKISAVGEGGIDGCADVNVKENRDTKPSTEGLPKDVLMSACQGTHSGRDSTARGSPEALPGGQGKKERDGIFGIGQQVCRLSWYCCFYSNRRDYLQRKRTLKPSLPLQRKTANSPSTKTRFGGERTSKDLP